MRSDDGDHAVVGFLSQPEPMMTLKDRFTKLIAQLDRLGRMAVLAAMSLALLLIVAPLNPLLVASYLWVLCKLSAAAALGYGVDRAAFRDEPEMLEGIERTMTHTRRATLIVGAMISSGLIG